MSNTPQSPAQNEQDSGQTWVKSQWKNPSIPGQISAVINIAGFASAKVIAHKVMEGFGLRDTNGPDKPDAIAPRDGSGLGVEDGRVKGGLAPLSYHVLRLDVS